MKNILLIIILFSNIYIQAQTYQWTKSFNDIQGSYSNGIKIDSQGNTYIFGSLQGTIDLDPSPTSAYNVTSDHFLLKLDSNGNFIWAKGIGDISIYSLNIDNDGNVLYTGLSSENIIISKLNPNGDILWTNHYGGIGIDGGISILHDSNNNILVSGIFGYTVDFSSGLGTQILDANQGKGFCLKLSPNGDFIWVKQIKGIGNITVNSAAIDSNDCIYLCGSFTYSYNYTINGVTTNVFNYQLNNSNIYYNDGYIQKINSLGETTWAYTIGGNNSDDINCIAIDKDNNLLAYGNQGFTTIDYNPSSQVNTIPANSYHFVLKFDANENFMWVKGIGGDVDRCFDLKIDNNKSIYVLGSFVDQIDFDPGSGLVINCLSSSYQNIFILNLNPDGNYYSCNYQEIHMANFVAKMDIFNSDLYIASDINETADLNPLGSHDYITSSSYSDFYVSKFNISNLKIATFNKPLFRLLNNPVTNFIQLAFDTDGTKEVEVYNSLGMLISTQSITSDFISLDASNYATGVYFVKCKMEGMEQTIKFIKE